MATKARIPQAEPGLLASNHPDLRLPLRALVDSYRAALLEAAYAPRSVEQRIWVIGHFLDWAEQAICPHIVLLDVTEAVITRYYDSLARLAVSSRSSYISGVNSFCAWVRSDRTPAAAALPPGSTLHPHTPLRELLEPYRAALEVAGRPSAAVRDAARMAWYFVGFCEQQIDPNIALSAIDATAVERYSAALGHLSASSRYAYVTRARAFLGWATAQLGPRTDPQVAEAQRAPIAPGAPMRNLLPNLQRSLEAKKRRPRGIKKSIWVARLFIEWAEQQNGPTVKIGDITPAMMRRYQESLSNLAPSTVANYMIGARALFAWAKREELIERDPTAEIELPRRPRPIPKALKAAELRALMKAIEEPWDLRPLERLVWERNALAVHLMLFAGLRISEAVNLNWSDIDLDARALVVFDGKGGKDRVVPLHRKLQAKLELTPPHERRGAVLRSFKKGHTSRAALKSVENTFRRWLPKLGVRCSAHMLRHSFASQSLKGGADIRSIQMVMGHADLATTARYLLIDPEQTRAAVDCIPDEW